MPADVLMSPVLMKREHTHRRLLLLGLSTLLLLSILPTVGHHLFSAVEAPLGNVDHIGDFCAAALRILLSPVHGAFHIALAMGLSYGVWDRIAAWHSLRTILGSLESHSPASGTPLSIAASRAGMNREMIRVVSGLANPAFTAGMWSPRIFVRSNLELQLTQDELDCVIAHEASHVNRRDPLRLSTYRFLGCLLFWMPALRGLAADMADEAEIEADTFAGKDRPFALASAILAIAAGPHSVSASRSRVFFHNPDLLDRRIRRLTGENTPLPTRLSRRSLSFASVAVTLVLLSGLAAAQPSREGAGDNHCGHHHASLWSHLWCSPGDCQATSGHCEHSG